jgi:hypothetical protein
VLLSAILPFSASVLLTTPENPPVWPL